ncbi:MULTISPECIES: hypothetical protein [Paraburkholderia]|uniref:hypothetical protein n=1 Tax=Paraburkholderia TaxID=1822464 RepID=UPI0022556177|nr:MULTISPECIES: hypothetical protein [Paraburkholderia]MCX4156675.1 hypothetical protein [Paraburkholderia aspalathi]MDN7166080.1 hypothetical protein [Paraburkholderia sp. SECH2]MDQ6394566.1 hypothetical protein [Paraburkholderia aspalathi]
MDDQSCNLPEEISGSYHREILAAHEGEILGHSFFREMSCRYQADPYAKRTFMLLAEVERGTRVLMRDLLAKHHVACPAPDVSIARGLAVAQSLSGVAWDRLMVEMAKRISPAVVRFECLLSKAPVDDRVVIALLVEHERALDAFVRCKPHRSNEALRPCVKYLRRLKLHNASVSCVGPH